MILNIVGARPNFVKMAPLVKEMIKRGLPQYLLHTGQHYDRKMSDLFFTDLRFPHPDLNLGVGSASHALQTARIMEGFEPVCLRLKPWLVVVAGDVNSTLACALTAAKLGIPVAHVEAGLRSFDRGMPEETNRILTDHLSEMLFTTEPSGALHLAREGIAAEKIHAVGNTMIDSLKEFLEKALALAPWKALGLHERGYALVTLHRPENVEHPGRLAALHDALQATGALLPVLFPVHPRTQLRFQEQGMTWEKVELCEPVGYLEFLGLMAGAKMVLTDSGGIQEETTALGIPCLTLRDNTERPVTAEVGTNRILGADPDRILSAVMEVMESGYRLSARVPDLWDGKASVRIVDILQKWISGRVPGQVTDLTN